MTTSQLSDLLSQMAVTMTASLVLQWLQVFRGWFLDEWIRLDLLFAFITQWSIVTFMTHKRLWDTIYPVKRPKMTQNDCNIQKMTVTTTPSQHKMTKVTARMTMSTRFNNQNWNYHSMTLLSFEMTVTMTTTLFFIKPLVSRVRCYRQRAVYGEHSHTST